ncbi:MFS transporter [Caballeronia sp. 15711]|uniref:MFS transporter n=1 Tax=Caballeronia sp. 15711 TaxID=3391029 RepID=UPI0039E3C357
MYKKLSGLLLGNLAICSNALVTTALLMPLRHEFHLTDAQATSFAFVYGLAYAAVAPFIGVLTAPFPRHRVALGGIAIFIFGCVISACADSSMILWIGRVFTAVGAALFTPTASDLAASVEPARRGQAVSYVYLGLGGATLVGIPGAMWLSTVYNWRMAFLAFAATAFLAGCLVAMMPWPPRDAIGKRGKWSAIFRDLRVIGSLSSTLLVATAQYALYTFASAYLILVDQFSIATATTALMVFGIAGIVGGILGGIATDRLGGHRILWVSPAVLLISHLALLGVHREIGTFLILAAWGLAAYSFQAPQQTRLMSLMPNDRSMILSFNSTANYCGISAGAAFGGLIVDRIGLHTLPWVSAAIALVALLSCLPAALTSSAASSRPA